jgi:hypothetical protein
VHLLAAMLAFDYVSHDGSYHYHYYTIFSSLPCWPLIMLVMMSTIIIILLLYHPRCHAGI